ncbi:hypothetical protein QBC38DRAFT_270181 [Podospora fimiseda]|uniref:Uncharacterized protein n=1 Tax=Podospora fimiseda TaxID=252190 RepID=A0AAN7GVE5_9PEZI|nr:hypothetical protein QBC38DRAFT_270181 [Podospora fimiseda]
MADPLHGPFGHRHQEVIVAANFIATKGPQFHEAFGVPTILNQSTMQYEPPEIYDLKETLECSQTKARKYLDFAQNLQECTWEHVHAELNKARKKAEESERRGRSGFKKLWRVTGATSSVLSPGLAALPDSLCVLHGGLAVVFSLARHSEMNRIKILSVFDSVPNIIEEAKNKSEKFPPSEKNPKTIQLDESIKELQLTLLRVLPDLINRLIPGTWRNAWRSPFVGWTIDKLLDEVKHRADSVRVRAEALMDDIVVGNYEANMEIKAQLKDLRRQNDLMHMSIKAANSQTDFLHFLLEQFASPLAGMFQGRGLPNVANMGTALPGFIPSDLLVFMDVNHTQARHDSRIVLSRSSSFEPHDMDKASQMASAPEVKGLLGSPGAGVVAVDGHLDITQIGKITPLSFACAMSAQALKIRTQVTPSEDPPYSPTSPLSDAGQGRCIVLEYYCSLHMADNDNLYGPKGLVRCLTTQLILSMVENEYVFHEEPVHLPHLGDTEDADELLSCGDLNAICNLFIGLLQLIPHGVSVYGIVDGWSVYERNEAFKADYRAVLDMFRDATSPEKFDAGACFKLLLTSPTMSRQLGEFLLPGQRVSLRRDRAGVGSWSGVGRKRGMGRAATMPEVGVGYSSSHSSSGSVGDGHSRRSSS